MIVDGKKIAQELNAELQQGFAQISGAQLALIAVDPDAVTLRFMQAKKRLAESLGVIVIEKIYSATETTEKQLLDDMVLLSHSVDGMVVQLPLPEIISTQRVLDTIPVRCDIDLLSPETYDAWRRGSTSITPPVAAAIVHVLEYFGIDCAGKKIAVVGYGKLVGKPTSDMLGSMGIEHDVITLDTDAQVRNTILMNADIIISGAGAPYSITPDQVHEGVIIIDAGTSESGGVLAGDVHSDVAAKASIAALVPGGVGPIAISMLFKNLLHAARS